VCVCMCVFHLLPSGVSAWSTPQSCVCVCVRACAYVCVFCVCVCVCVCNEIFSGSSLDVIKEKSIRVLLDFAQHKQ